MSKFKQGLYTVKNPHKYVGDVTKVRYMSSWELRCHEYFDNNDQFIKWSSECVAIPYLKPTDKKMHKYFPDYWIQYINSSNEVIEAIVEVKPLKQTKPPRGNSKHKLFEQIQYSINASKWLYAQAWCKQHNMTFMVINENHIFK